MLCSLPGQAAACRQALVLGLDVSLSVDNSDFQLQRMGLARALTDPAVVQAMIAPMGNHVELAVFEWTSTFNQSLLVDWTVIDNPERLHAIAADLAEKPQGMRSGRTAIGAAMLYARDLLQGRAHCLNRTVDISGDGPSNTGPLAEVAKRAMQADGITVNALVIEDDAFPGLQGYFRDQVITGPGAFVQTARGFADYRRAMVRKLLREVTPSLSSLQRNVAPGTGGKARQRPVPDLPADQAQCGMPDMGGHAPDLSVAPLRDGQPDPAIGHRFAKAHRGIARPEIGRVDPLGLRRAGRPILQHDALPQRIERRVTRQALDLHQIGFRGLVPWIADAGLYPSIIGQDQQALAVAIQPPGGIDPRQVNEARKGGARSFGAVLVGEL